MPYLVTVYRGRQWDTILKKMRLEPYSYTVEEWQSFYAYRTNPEWLEILWDTAKDQERLADDEIEWPSNTNCFPKKG